MFRKATINDIDAITSIYDKIHDLDEAGKIHVGWKRGLYPVRQTALDSLNRGDLYVCELDGKVVASAIINETELSAYREVQWHTPAKDNEVLVLHTLVVNPDVSNQGIGHRFVDFYEQLARKGGYKVLRIDTQAQNDWARRMYKSLGFTEVGIVVTDGFYGLPPVNLVLLEKPVK